MASQTTAPRQTRRRSTAGLDATKTVADSPALTAGLAVDGITPDRAETGSSPSPSRLRDDSDTLPRLSIPVRNGSIAWDQMRDTTKDKLRALLANEPASTIAPDAGGFDDGLCAVLYGALSSVAVAVARKQGYPREAAAVLAFTPDEIATLSPLTAKVLNKWIPLGKYGDEMQLALALSGVVIGKAMQLQRSAQVLSLAPQPTATGTDAQ